MVRETRVSEEIDVASERTGAKRGPIWPLFLVGAIAICLWSTRLSGPIDLRWDAGVYYILGSSLYQGTGYRLLSEPGNPQAVEYPPLLPALAAAYQCVLGSSDPAVAGPWLRYTYAALFLLYGLAVYALARNFLNPYFSLATVALCLLQVWTIFLSDVFFAELPFALVSVCFALVAVRRPNAPSFECYSFSLATAGYLLRTAGLALFAAWVIEAVVRKKWKLAVARTGLSLLPILGWQIWVGSVLRSQDYNIPAYSYQRAAYQNYNVTYQANLRLRDPFRPERGLTTPSELARRFLSNVARIPQNWGEAISLPRSEGSLRERYFLVGKGLALLSLTLGLAALGGAVLFVKRRQWLLVGVVVISTALICFTPWPEEFHRYLMPVASFIALAACFCAQSLIGFIRERTSHAIAFLLRGVIAFVLSAVIVAQSVTAVRFLRRAPSPQVRQQLPGANFYVDPAWIAWAGAADWTKAHALDSDVVATTAPHQVYLRTGLKAIYPPFEKNAKEEIRQLNLVPVRFVIVDQFSYRDFTRRYALPALESVPTEWPMVYATCATRVFRNSAQ